MSVAKVRAGNATVPSPKIILVEETIPLKVEVADPITAKLVAVTLVAVTVCKKLLPSTVKVEVTVELAATKPPYKRKVVVENDPRAVTDASVSLSLELAGQFVPFARQTAKPLTKSCEVETVRAPNHVAVAEVKVALPPKMVPEA